MRRRLQLRPATRRALACAAAVLALHVAIPSGAPGEALTMPRPRAPQKALLSYGDYELMYLARGEGQGLMSRLPRLKVRRIPLPIMKLDGGEGHVGGSLDRQVWATFPFTTQNAASVRLAFPRVAGRLHVGLEDPSAAPDLEDSNRQLEASYEQPISGVGDVSVSLASTGEWEAALTRQVEGLGHLRTSVSSQLDWSADLEKTYDAHMGVIPTISYGVTQDGGRVRAQLDRPGSAGVFSRYAVRSLPGMYSPADLIHEGLVTLPAGSGKVELRAEYDHRLPEVPTKGSLAYATEDGKRLEAAIDGHRFRVHASTQAVEASAALEHKAELEGAKGLRGRAAELELRIGKASASARFGKGKPDLRLGVAL